MILGILSSVHVDKPRYPSSAFLLPSITITEIDVIPFILFFAMVSALILSDVDRRPLLFKGFIFIPISNTLKQLFAWKRFNYDPRGGEK